MKEIKLTQGKVAIVDDADYDSLKYYRWFVKKAPNTYYAYRTNKEHRNILMHRSILNAPDGVEIDHINSTGLDSRRLNLRFCKHSENLKNQKMSSRNKIGFKGVSCLGHNRKKPYRASIWINNKNLCLGYYSTPERAAQAYDEAALKQYGQFARTNKMLGLLR